jgi:hypothetical protein
MQNGGITHVMIGGKACNASIMIGACNHCLYKGLNIGIVFKNSVG